MLRRVSVVGIVLLTAIACSKGSSRAAAMKSGPAVAEGKNFKITAGELKTRIDEQSPMVRSSFQNPERKKQFLDSMIRFELLAQAAEKEGFANDPDVLFATKKAMVSKYYQKLSQSLDAAKNVPDEEIQKYYDDHKDEFHRPARVRSSHILLAAKPGTPERAKKTIEAKKILAKILADEQKNPGAFAAVARERSDDAATKASGGDLSFKSAADLEKAYGKPFADAVMALGDGKTSPTVIESPEGLHLIRVSGKIPEMNRTLEEAKPQITSRLNSQRKQKEFDDHVKKLREAAGVKVNDAEIEKVAINLPQGAPGTPGAAGPKGPPGAAPAPAASSPAPASGPSPAKPAPATPGK